MDVNSWLYDLGRIQAKKKITSNTHPSASSRTLVQWISSKGLILLVETVRRLLNPAILLPIACATPYNEAQLLWHELIWLCQRFLKEQKREFFLPYSSCSGGESSLHFCSVQHLAYNQDTAITQSRSCHGSPHGESFHAKEHSHSLWVGRDPWTLC